MQLSQHFSLEEATFSQTALNLGIDNNPSQDIIERMILVADKMERVRTILGDAPIFVSSWYRCNTLNEKIGGAKNSAHPLGYAVDFRAFRMSVENVCSILRDALPYDQLINEYGRWTHISFDPRNRKQFFKIG